MQTSNRIFDDLARVANGAVSTLTGIKGEIEALVRQQLERLLADMDLVPRDEFDAVKAMAAKARTRQNALERKIDELEAKLGGKSSGSGRERATPKTEATRSKVDPGTKKVSRKSPRRTPK